MSTPPEIAIGTHFHVRHGTKTALIFLAADGEASLCCYFQFGLLAIWQHIATRKHLLLYPEDDRSGLIRTNITFK